MRESNIQSILFDYPQAQSRECTRGGLIHSYYLAKYLSRSFVISGIRPYSNPKIISEEIGTIFFSDFFSRSRSLTYFVHSLFAAFNTREFDLIYTRYVYSWKQYGFLLKLLTSKPWVVEVNGASWDEEHGLIYRKFFRKFFLYPIQWADKVIFVSKTMRDTFLAEILIDSDKIALVQNGVDEKKFTINSDPALRSTYDLHNNNFIVTFVGVVEKWQGLDILLKVAEKLKQTNTRCQFLIVGNGRYLDRMRQEIKALQVDEYFLFTGSVSQPKVRDYISLANICIAPFAETRKASPIKIFEYLACGKKVIVPAIPDIIGLGLNDGLLLYNAGDSDSLLNQLITAIQSETNLQSSKKLRDIVIARGYTWENVVLNVAKEIGSLK